jgi:hypothetical protein
VGVVEHVLRGLMGDETVAGLQGAAGDGLVAVLQGSLAWWCQWGKREALGEGKIKERIVMQLCSSRWVIFVSSQRSKSKSKLL